MSASVTPSIVAFGEDAWLIEMGAAIDAVVSARVHALWAAIDGLKDRFPGLRAAVPAYASVLVPFDPGSTDARRLRDALVALAAEIGAAPPHADDRLLEVPVRYGGDYGPDLTEVAEACGMSVQDVVAMHAGTTYRVFMLGFSPGFAYLGILPPQLRLPRRSEPRLRVPAGSVAIAAAQTAVYPHSSAGGWHLIGRTEKSFWDVTAIEPALLRPGDRVRFVPI